MALCCWHTLPLETRAFTKLSIWAAATAHPNGRNSWMLPIGLCISLGGRIRYDMLLNWSLKTMWVVTMFELVFAHFWILIGSLWYLEGLVTIRFGSRTYNQIPSHNWNPSMDQATIPPHLFTKSKFFWYISKYEFSKKETIKPYFLGKLLVLNGCTWQLMYNVLFWALYTSWTKSMLQIILKF